MHVQDHLSWEQFEQKFRDAFDREMTADEHRWFHAIWSVVNGRKAEKSKAAVA